MSVNSNPLASGSDTGVPSRESRELNPALEPFVWTSHTVVENQDHWMSL